MFTLFKSILSSTCKWTFLKVGFLYETKKISNIITYYVEIIKRIYNLTNLKIYKL